jgi:hypothetical protein
MKKSLGTYITRTFKMPHLYRDDLEKIDAIIAKDIDPKRYGIAYAGLEYDGIDEVPKIQ